MSSLAVRLSADSRPGRRENQVPSLRELKEAALAVKLERQLSKQQILERYLNEVYFGRGAYGVEAATRCCALTMRAVAISSWARVIFFVALTDAMRRR